MAYAALIHANFRKDIEGLRGVAVLLVVAYHAGVPFVSGGFVGVDVFFVVSGYLITGLLVRERERSGRVDLAAFYGRRIRRLLPASMLVILFSAALAAALYGPVEQARYARTAIAAAAYVSNFWLANVEGDYFATGAESDPLLHMWSLSVEEQFYIIWPLLIIGILSVATTRGRAAWILGAVVLASFLPAFWYTHFNRPIAFYYTPLRAWEFGAGALLALLPAAARWPGAVSQLCALTGAALVVGSGLVLSSSSPFPGEAAIPVVVGTALLLVPGHTGSGRVALLETPVIQRLGTLSYSWYLWHWPILVAAKVLLPGATWPVRAAIAVASLVPAALAHHYVENPLRYGRWLAPHRGRSLLFGAALPGFVVASMAANHVRASRLAESPDFVQVVQASRFGPIEEANCIAKAIGPMTECEFGSPDGARVILYGDSHASHWGAALIPMAEERGWRLTVLAKRSCPPTDIDQRRSTAESADCVAWRRDALRRISEIGPALVIMSHSQAYVRGRVAGDEPLQEWGQGLARVLDHFESAGAAVVLLQDTPRFATPVPDCLARRFAWVARGVDCDASRSEGINAELLAVERTHVAARAMVRAVDINDHLCNGAVCPAVLDGIIAYRDNHHLSPAMAAHLKPVIERTLLTALGEIGWPAVRGLH